MSSEIVGYGRFNLTSMIVEQHQLEFTKNNGNFVWSPWMTFTEEQVNHYKLIYGHESTSFQFMELKFERARELTTLYSNIVWTETTFQVVCEIEEFFTKEYQNILDSTVIENISDEDEDHDILRTREEKLALLLRYNKTTAILRTREEKLALLLRYKDTFESKIKYLNEYGGVINSGIPQSVPEFSSLDSEEYRQSTIDYVEEYNKTGKNLAQRYLVFLYRDSAPMSFGIGWHVIKNQKELVYDERNTMNGGLVCHISGHETFTVNMSDHAWGIHT